MEKDLSEKTREIMDLLAAGLSEAEVAARLYLSNSTVSYHVRQAQGLLSDRTPGSRGRGVRGVAPRRAKHGRVSEASRHLGFL